MSLDVWFKDDIRNTLLALNETSLDTHALVVSLAGDSASAASYRSGYGDALRAVAIAFGIAYPRQPETPTAWSFPAAPAEAVSGRLAQRLPSESSGHMQ